jgi:valyl-tRNA synthetase
MTDLPKAYSPREVVGAIYARLAGRGRVLPGWRRFDRRSGPPAIHDRPAAPNVTGSLHLRYAQRTAVEDLMIRHARMRGHPTLFLPGLDHASIAAQFVLDGIMAK